MNPQRKRSLCIAAVSTALGVLAVGVPHSAHADGLKRVDRHGGEGSLANIRTVAANHSASRVAVVTSVTDLQRRPEGSASLFIRIDTNQNRPGAEFQFATALEDGTDYNLRRVRNGKAVGTPLTCNHTAKLNYSANKVRFSAARGCLGNPHKVRISVHTRDHWDGSHPVTDWLGAPHSFTRWLQRG